MTNRKVIFGSRGSPLALAQVQEAVDLAIGCGVCCPDKVEIKVIKTTGDLKHSVRLSDIGGKGVFSKELEDALLAEEIDIAVHSMKDLPILQPNGLIIDGILPRAAPNDALISRKAKTLQELPDGARIGTSSLRRGAQILRLNPKLVPVNFRGNLGTRLQKLDAGEADAAVLALAGLHRLNLPYQEFTPIPILDMLPAPAQGAICLERRLDDVGIAKLVAQLNDEETEHRVAAERALLSGLGGDCETPIGALAEVIGTDIQLRGELLRPDGASWVSKSIQGPMAEASELGLKLARRILAEFHQE